MTSLRRFTHGIVPFVLLASCAELIGLSDYETGEASDDGGGGEEETGGRGGSGASGGSGGSGQGGSGGMGAKPGVGGEEDGGDGGKGGTISRGGATSDGGMAGETDGGDGGKGGTGGTGPTGGAAGGGKGGMGGASGVGGAGNAGNAGSGGTGGSPVCTEITLSTYIGAIIDVTQAPAIGAYDFEIEPELGQSFPDMFEIQFWDSGGGGSYDGALTGSFMLGAPGDDSNYAFCSRCLIVYQDQDTTREKIFFQTEGTINLADMSQQMDGFPRWTFDDVTLREVTIDADQISTVVPGGECVHITTHSFTREAPTNWTCDITWYSDGDCDCGCGQLDPTCVSSAVAACDYCWCNTTSSCNPNEVVATSNWLCQ